MWRVVAGKIKEKAGNRFPRSLVTGALGLAIVIPSVGWYADTGTSDTDPSTGDLLATLQWLRGHENPDPTRPGVLAEWSHGHHIEYLAEKPVVANPFGTDIGLDAMADAAEFFLARDPSVAERVVNRRRMGFVMLTNPVEEAHFALAFAPSGTAPVVDVTPARLSEMQVHVDDGFWGLVASRLYFFDGMVPAGYAGEALGGYRLLYESPTDQRWDGHTAKVFKVYGVVAGANISVHTSSGSRVTARTTLTTNQGREVRWASTVVSDLRGTASIRLPYATGLNGAVDASAYELVSASRSTHIEVSEFDVVNGGKAVAFFGAPETLDLQPPTNN
jgi:asparagine N-glycosylation enzyme membrane subunit Stt3